MRLLLNEDDPLICAFRFPPSWRSCDVRSWDSRRRTIGAGQCASTCIVSLPAAPAEGLFLCPISLFMPILSLSILVPDLLPPFTVLFTVMRRALFLGESPLSRLLRCASAGPYPRQPTSFHAAPLAAPPQSQPTNYMRQDTRPTTPNRIVPNLNIVPSLLFLLPFLHTHPRLSGFFRCPFVRLRRARYSVHGVCYIFLCSVFIMKFKEEKY